jgi:predicted nuclease of restriction endonuclease-like (RecB) superfamily
LSWTHFRSLIYLDDPLKRDFYAEMCRIERWNTRTLEKKIGGMLFERTALSRKPEQLAREELMRLRDEDRLTPDLVFRDPYVLDFLQLQDSYSEKDLEAAILREIEAFILELGVGGTEQENSAILDHPESATREGSRSSCLVPKRRSKAVLFSVLFAWKSVDSRAIVLFAFC